MTDLQKQRITQLRGEGKSYAAIAGMLGISVNTVQSFCRRNNLSGVASASATDTQTAAYCKQCGKALVRTPGKKPRKFCSDSCCAAWWAAHPDLLKRKALYSFVCAYCGAEFTAYGNAHRKYCRHACYIADRFGKEAAR
jgi:endogenous inhibitor of DNA gyrase (YacG/DUF329 family)